MATADRETTDREPETPRGPASTALPNARLNPLLNPLLAKQLGRWAHIYYTASVDKREAAIEKLVCELEAEEAKMAEAETAAYPATRETHPQSSPAAGSPASRIPGPVLVTSPQPEPPPVPQSVVSNAVEAELALHEVPIGEPRNSEALPVVVPPPANPAARFEEPIQSLPVESLPAEPLSVESVSIESVPVDSLPEAPAVTEAVPESWQGLLRRHAANLPAEEPQAADPAYIPATDRTSAEDYRSFGDLLAKSDAALADTMPATPSAFLRGRSALIAAAVLLALGGALWVAKSRLMQDIPSHPRTSAQTTVPQKAPTPSPAAVAQVPAPAGQTIKAVPSSTTSVPLTGGRNPGDLGNPGVHGVILAKDAPPAETVPPADPELAAGMRSLEGQGVPRDSAEAARHLWLSVKNQNGSALIVLAGLYARGDGVAKDCDQAKILLDAAARQAKSHTQFQHVETARETLRSSGCE